MNWQAEKQRVAGLSPGVLLVGGGASEVPLPTPRCAVHSGAAERPCTHPELYQVERVLRALAEQLLQAALLLGKLVVDLSDVDALQQGVAVAEAALADVHKQVLVVLQGDRRSDGNRLLDPLSSRSLAFPQLATRLSAPPPQRLITNPIC